MTQIEFKDLNCSLNTESFLEDLTDESVHIVGGTIEDSVALASTRFKTSFARTEESISQIETTLSNLPADESHGRNYAFFYTTNSSYSHCCRVFQTF
jgi:hypothetical protein